MTGVRRGLVAAGVALMAYALAGALADADVRPGGALVFLAAVLVAHDAVLLPLVIGAGALIGRLVPPGDRAVVRGAALCSLAVTVVALPLLLGYGRDPANPSALPLPYGRGLATVLTAVWAAALGAAAARRLRARRLRAGWLRARRLRAGWLRARRLRAGWLRARRLPARRIRKHSERRSAARRRPPGG